MFFLVLYQAIERKKIV